MLWFMTMRNDQIGVWLPVLAGSSAALCTIVIHSLALGASVSLVRRERRLGRAGSGLFIDLGIFVASICFAFAAHLSEIALWAVLIKVCDNVKSFEVAYYLSASNYTTLGAGELSMGSFWKLLGPLEAANGALMFGVSTAMVFAVAQRLMRARFEDLSG